MPNLTTRVHKELHYNLPVSGGGSDIALGAFLKKGATAASHNGHLRVAGSGTTTNPDLLAVLNELHDTSVSGDTDVAGTTFATRKAVLIHPFRIFRMEFDLSDAIDATEAVSTTTMTITSLEDDIDAAFWYVAAGTGAGQTNYSTASASGSTTLKAAFGTDLDTTSELIKIPPRFHQLIALTSDGTQLGSTAAAGGTSALVIDTYISRNNNIQQLDPTAHDALTGLNDLRSIRFYADVAIRDAGPYTID